MIDLLDLAVPREQAAPGWPLLSQHHPEEPWISGRGASILDAELTKTRAVLARMEAR